MTLQVAMICHDGWVLASDRIRIETGGPRVRGAIEKIVIDESRGFAYSFFGDDCAMIAGDELLRHAPSFKPQSNALFSQWLLELGNDTWKLLQETEQGAFSTSYRARGLIICLKSVPDRFWVLGIGKVSRVIPFIDKTVMGDIGSSSRFFVDRFHTIDLPVSKAMLLASYVLTTGEILNPAGVGGGIDMVICKSGKMEAVSPETVKTLIQRSREIDESIKDSFLSV
jgi:hypothetical protein